MEDSFLGQPWYRSVLSRVEAESFLKPLPTGFFVVRPSSQAGCLCLSYNKRTDQQLHVLLRHGLGGQAGWALDGTKDVYPTVGHLLASLPLRQDQYGEGSLPAPVPPIGSVDISGLSLGGGGSPRGSGFLSQQSLSGSKQRRGTAPPLYTAVPAMSNSDLRSSGSPGGSGRSSAHPVDSTPGYGHLPTSGYGSTPNRRVSALNTAGASGYGSMPSSPVVSGGRRTAQATPTAEEYGKKKFKELLQIAESKGITDDPSDKQQLIQWLLAADAKQRTSSRNALGPSGYQSVPDRPASSNYGGLNDLPSGAGNRRPTIPSYGGIPSSYGGMPSAPGGSRSSASSSSASGVNTTYSSMPSRPEDGASQSGGGDQNQYAKLMPQDPVSDSTNYGTMPSGPDVE